MEEVLSSVTQEWMKQIDAKDHEVKAAQHQLKAAQLALKESEKERYEALREREENKNALPVCDIQPGKPLTSYLEFAKSSWLSTVQHLEWDLLCSTIEISSEHSNQLLRVTYSVKPSS